MIKNLKPIAIGLVAGLVGMGAANLSAQSSPNGSGDAIEVLGETEFLHASGSQVRYCQIESRGQSWARIECTNWF